MSVSNAKVIENALTIARTGEENGANRRLFGHTFTDTFIEALEANADHFLDTVDDGGPP